MRLVFAGTPEAALPSLDAIADSGHDLCAVITRPDARSGRGRALAPTPVKARALELGVPVWTPVSVRDPDFLEALRALGPDAAAVVAYGNLIPPSVLAIPPHGWVNLHFSLLPAWRGAAPVQHAVIAGDEITGASTFRLEAGLDTGPVFGTLTEPILPTDTSSDLLARLARAGAGLLVATLDGIAAGRLQPVPQPFEGVSHAPKLEVADARIRFDRPAFAIDRRIRGCTPAPGAWTTFRGERLKLGPLARLTPGALAPATGTPGAGTSGAQGPRPLQALAPGAVRPGRASVEVGTATDPVTLGQVQPLGKRPMPAADWARGARIEPGERLGEEPG